MAKIVLFPLLALSLWADPSSQVQFSNCTEYVGTGQIPLSRVQKFVPPSFQALVGPNQTATLVVRAARCGGVKVDNDAAEPGILTQIGVSVVSPDGSGDINNYTVAYATNSRRLAQRLERSGLPVSVDPDLVYEVTPNPPGASGEIFVDSSPTDAAAFFLNGKVSDPLPNSAFPFLANWWFESKKGRMKMATAIPAISFGSAAVTVYSRKNSPVGELIGGNSFSAFNGFNVRGVFATARMDVSTR